jgi:CRISPR/Cas system-associated endoribonuclease Cas2
MLMSIGAAGVSASRWVAFAYDIADPKRAREARGILAPHAGPRQYSVYECRMRYGWSHDLLAELSAVVHHTEDRLALWWPRNGTRVALQGNGKRSVRMETGDVEVVGRARCAELMAGAGNFIVSYDIVDPDRARHVHATVASGGVMLQRSLYQWRCGAAVLFRMLDRCAEYIEPEDRFWVHPLRRIGDLWQLREAPSSLLPIATHHWNS